MWSVCNQSDQGVGQRDGEDAEHEQDREISAGLVTSGGD
jgi:hypothetical protein